MRKIKNFKDYKLQTWLSLSTFIYGVSLAFSRTTIRIAEFPPRLYLILACFIIPMLSLYVIYKGYRDASRNLVVASTALWSVIGVLYAVNDISNAGWVLAMVIIGVSFISLYEGEGVCR